MYCLSMNIRNPAVFLCSATPWTLLEGHFVSTLQVTRLRRSGTNRSAWQSTKCSAKKDEEFTQAKTTKHEIFIIHAPNCPLGIPSASHLSHGCIKTKLSESIPSMARCRDSKRKWQQMSTNVTSGYVKGQTSKRCWKHHGSMVARKG